METSESPIDVAALDRLRELFRRDKAAVCSQFSEWFYSYHADLYVHGVPFEVYVRKMEAIRRELAGARIVLDVGAGFGVYACLLRILGVPRTVSDHLLQILFDYVKSPDVQTRVAWQEGAAVIWDNRVVQHRGVADYGDGLRVLHRAIVQ